MAGTLSLNALPSLPEQVERPTYLRDDLSPGILHFGVGNFHRAHQAVYLHELFNQGEGQDWALIGASVRSADADIRHRLERQDWLSTVVERDAFVQSAHVTGAMIDYLEPGDARSILEALADPRIRIVSLTITEGGYFLNAATGRFDPTHPEIVADAQSPEMPKTVFGLIAAGLRLRRDAGVRPFTVMSCDNIPGNGHVAQQTTIGLVRLSDPDFANWIKREVAFPNSMVDRITPATSQAEIDLVEREFGVADSWPVACETFKQWVIEDQFTSGRPPLEKVGVTFVDDVVPFELMKLRILNGGHAAIAYPAALMDIHFVHEAMNDELIAAYLDKLERDEIIPAVPPVGGVDLEAYYTKVVERFANPTVGDTIQRLCLDGSNRQPKFVLPTARDRVANGESVTGLALVSALWCRYCAGTTDSGATIAPNDPDWDRLQKFAKQAKVNPAAYLAMDDIFGSLATDPAYVAAFSTSLNSLWANGTKVTLERYLAGTL